MQREKSFVARLLLVFMLSLVFSLPTSLLCTANSVVYAEESLDDDLSGEQQSGSVEQQNQSQGENGSETEFDVGGDDASVGDFLKNQRSMTPEQLKAASETVSPLTNALGYLIGALVTITGVGIFVITAIDLLYISIPPVRQFLYEPNTDGTGAATGGRMGGYGMGGYGMGGYGNQGMAQGARRKIQWVSDEAVQCAALFGGSAVTSGQQMGGYGMGGYGMQGQQQQEEASRKSVIKTYLFKRIFFLILFAICTVILLSSVFIGTGVNLAQWAIKLIQTFNTYIPK